MRRHLAAGGGASTRACRLPRFAPRSGGAPGRGGRCRGEHKQALCAARTAAGALSSPPRRVRRGGPRPSRLLRAGAAHSVTWHRHVAHERGRQQGIGEAAGRAHRVGAVGFLCGAAASAGEAAAGDRGGVATFARLAHGNRGAARHAAHGRSGFPALGLFRRGGTPGPGLHFGP